MRTFKNLIFILLVLIPLILVSGCWDNRSITDIQMVSGIGIDRNSDGSVEVTAQVLSHTQSNSQSSGSSTQSSGKTVEVSAKGPTVSDAIFNLAPEIGNNIYLMHTQVMVIGEAAAKNGINEIWDYFERDHESSRTMYIIVAKGTTAKSVLSAVPQFEDVNAVQIADALQNYVNFGKNIGVQALKISQLLSEPSAGIVLGVITSSSNSSNGSGNSSCSNSSSNSNNLDDMKVEGGAVLEHAKLVGYFSDDETNGYQFAANQMNGCLLNIADPRETGKLVSIEVTHSDGKLSADIKDGVPELEVMITADGNITEEQGGADLTDEKDVETLKSETEASIKQNILAAITKSQKVYNCDILDFNDILYKYHYDAYEKIQDNWDEAYKNATVKVDVNFTLQRPGMILKPAYNQ